MNYLAQNTKSHRVILPDLVRAFALFGIAVVNVAYFANPMGDYNFTGSVDQPIDQWAFMAVNSVFLMKSYTLFSFMFGVGFAYQMSAANRQSASFDTRYWRRIMGLFVLGFLNVIFLFQGDILYFYAFIGSVLYMFKDVSPKALNRWAIGFYIFQVLIMGLIALALWAGETYAPDEMKEGFIAYDAEMEKARQIFSSRGFWAVVEQRIAEWGQVAIFGSFLQGGGILAFFLFGLSAVKSGILHDASHPIWKKFRRWFLPVGLIGSCYGAWVMKSGTGMFSAATFIGMFWIMLFAPFSTAGYLGLIAKWADRPATPFKIFLARGGTSSLTAYLMQGLLLSLIFNGYGLGLFGDIGAARCILIAAFVAIFTIIFASLWRKKYQRGPMEVLLRRWTYGGDESVKP